MAERKGVSIGPGRTEQSRRGAPGRIASRLFEGPIRLEGDREGKRLADGVSSGVHVRLQPRAQHATQLSRGILHWVCRVTDLLQSMSWRDSNYLLIDGLRYCNWQALG